MDPIPSQNSNFMFFADGKFDVLDLEALMKARYQGNAQNYKEFVVKLELAYPFNIHSMKFYVKNASWLDSTRLAIHLRSHFNEADPVNELDLIQLMSWPLIVVVFDTVSKSTHFSHMCNYTGHLIYSKEHTILNPTFSRQKPVGNTHPDLYYVKPSQIHPYKPEPPVLLKTLTGKRFDKLTNLHKQANLQDLKIIDLNTASVVKLKEVHPEHRVK